MKTIHQMTTEEFMQVFEYNQNNKKAILFADKESAKDFIEVARKHRFKINNYYETAKTYLPLFLSVEFGGLFVAYYLLQKEPLDKKDVIRYKKGSIWTLSDNEWIPLQRDNLLKIIDKLREKNAKKSEKKVEESIEKVDAPKSEFGYFEVDGKTVFAHRYSNCQKENAKKPEKEVKENMKKENGFPDITVAVDLDEPDITELAKDWPNPTYDDSTDAILYGIKRFDKVAKDWVKPTQTVKEIRKEVLTKELEKIAVVLNFLIELRIPVQPSLITVYNECLKEFSEL